MCRVLKVLGDDSKVTAVAKGKMVITFIHSQGETMACIPNVYLVPQLGKNLFSPQRLIDKGYIGYHDRSGYTLRDPHQQHHLLRGQA